MKRLENVNSHFQNFYTNSTSLLDLVIFSECRAPMSVKQIGISAATCTKLAVNKMHAIDIPYEGIK